MNSDTLKAIRLHAGLTQYAMAKRLGVAQSTIGDIESKRRRCSDRIRAVVAMQFPINDEFLNFLRQYEKMNGISHDKSL